MTTKLPYVVAPGCIMTVFNKIKDAKVPDRLTQDFIETTLGCHGGNYKQFIPFAKKIMFINSDGTPTELYKKYRNNSTSRAAMAAAIRIGYKDIFERNEKADTLTKEQIKDLVIEITGLESKNRIVQLICQMFENLRQLADFKAQLTESNPKAAPEVVPPPTDVSLGNNGVKSGLNLSYIINIVLPKTDDAAVFNAIFKALKENLMR